MAAKLVVEEGDLKGLSLSLEEGDTWIIGRDPDECQLVIEDPLVSRRHLAATRSDQGFLVENLSETNPLLLNDEEIKEQPHLLQNGDTLKVGNEILRFYEDSSAHLLDEPSDFDDIDHPTGEEYPLIEEADVQMAPLTDSEEEFDETHHETHHETLDEHQDENQDTFFEENDELKALAEIDFGLIETGRWLLKVIGGPNSGAEFYMQAGNSYILGTDPTNCDIIFHDTSVSRQHARITITSEDTLTIEDLKSRNGTLINGAPIEGSQELPQSNIVTLGTTSFVVYDREGEMQTIISPLLPSIVKVLQQEPQKEGGKALEELPQAEPISQEELAKTGPAFEETPAEQTPAPPHRNYGPTFVLCAIIGLFVLAGVGTTALFQEKPVVMQTQENANELIQQALSSFPSIRWTFNKSNGSLLLLGHVSTPSEKNRIFYNLSDLKFIKNIDDSSIIIDEGVLSEVNSLLANNPEWKGIRVYSPDAGQFTLSGALKTRKQAEQLSSYLSINFPYLDLLKKQIIVEEDTIQQIQAWLFNAQLPDVKVVMNNGEIVLTGAYPAEKTNELNQVLGKAKQIPGVRVVSNQTQVQTAETGITDITNHYQVTGKSRIGNKYTVVINGRILSEGDDLDGMTIAKISSNQVLLKKDTDRFKIDY